MDVAPLPKWEWNMIESGDDSEWAGEGGYDGDRPKRKGGKGGGGKGGGGKGDRKGGNGNGGKGKAKGGGRDGNGGNYWGAWFQDVHFQ